ncbi:MAG: protein-methionine-sulfoxide reductase heme-binding subunit MsrQ [Pseudomonadota bacterium]
MILTATQTLNDRLRHVPTWPVYVLGALLPVWYLWLGLTGGLGVEPIKELEHRLGEAGLIALMVTLMISPLRRMVGVNLLKFRRALGLIAFYYILCHLLVWLVLDVQILSQVWNDILKRPYITIGMVGFVLMIPLALTSNNVSVRKLGPVRWRRLHQLSYVAAVLGAVHYVMLSKTWMAEPLLYLVGVLAILSLRFKRRA